MNELVNRNTALPANFGENLMKGIAETRSTMTVSDGGKPLLRLLKQGQWVYGPNNEPVEKGSQWAVNIASLSRGWVCWDDGELLGQVMASVQVERLLPPAPIDGVPFAEQFGMELTCVSGANDGELVLYKNNSVGFKRAFEKLLAEIQARWSSDKQYFWPVVELHEESYPHKKYGQIFNPLLPIVAWTDEQGTYSPDSEVEATPEPEPVAAASKRVRGTAKVSDYAPAAPEPLPSAQTHTGQRRRPVAR
jgi:hypothetical protein